MRESLVRVLATGILASLVACQDYFDNPGADALAVPDSISFLGLGVGDTCAEDADCRDGLGCVGGKCAPMGNRILDQKCLLSAECAAGLNCSWAGFCAEASSVPPGSECTSSVDCAKGDFCRLTSFSGYCETPSQIAADLGAVCGDTAGCMAGLVCSVKSGTCVPGSLLLNPDLFIGVNCPSPEDDAFGVHMEVPGTASEADFYSFPFPADARIRNGFLDLSEHPRPGPGLLGFDVVDAVLTAIDGEMTGFGVTTAVYFRFTGPVAEASLNGEGPLATIRFVNLDTGDGIPFTFRFAHERNKYLCEDSLYVHPVWSRPLAGNTTYAVIITSGVRSIPGDGAEPAVEPVSRDDLDALLSDDEPGEERVREAWKTFAPLRGWLGPDTLLREKVAGATVFTTADPTAAMRLFGEDAPSWSLPVLVEGSAVQCKKGVQSPCATPGWESTPAASQGTWDPRDCPKENTEPAGYLEVHARIRLPVFQGGERPYQKTGGGIRIQDGRPEQFGTEEVCIAFAIPSGGAMAPAGWPLVLYAHGTDGSFRGGVERLAASMASQGIALVGIDQPMHGSRRNSSLDPGPLFYNYSNPRAAKGNLYQGAVENFALIDFLAKFNGPMGSAAKVSFDTKKIVFMGHSQGATTGPLFVPFDDRVKGTVLSGAGGSLVHGLLDKEKPNNTSVGVRNALQEIDLDEYHPVLNLIQFYFEETDPLVYASLLFREPVGSAVHVLNAFGWDDRYTPWKTSVILAAALGGVLGMPDHRPLDWDPSGLDPVIDLGLDVADLPVTGNMDVDGQSITGVSISAVSDGPHDGHFISFHEPVVSQIMGFVESTMDGGAPTVPAGGSQ